MVKIKEGYVMSPTEKAEYDRVNALPRKASGTVSYFFKPQTKYPPRIYVFMHAEIWCDRNRRPMGLHTAFPFLTRPMNSEEIEYHHFDTRLCYHQYEDWDKLIFVEEKEAEQLDQEQGGIGSAFLERLKSYRLKYPLKALEREIPPVPPQNSGSEELRYFKELQTTAACLSASEISQLLMKEQKEEKRPLILALLRSLYQSSASDTADKVVPTLENMERQVAVSQERSRRNFVRRTYKRCPLLALLEIQQKYPCYSEQQLLSDLKVKHRKVKRKKHKPIVDLRRCQLQKLAVQLKRTDDDGDYHKICGRMALLQSAHDQKLPIPLLVKLEGKSLVYDFNWKSRERAVKDFVDLANRPGMTHETLKVHYTEIIRLRNSF